VMIRAEAGRCLHLLASRRIVALTDVVTVLQSLQQLVQTMSHCHMVRPIKRHDGYTVTVDDA
jgi:hypothetical protein